MDVRTKVIVLCFAVLALGFAPSGVAEGDLNEASGNAGPCDGGSIVDDACQTFLMEGCDEVRDPEMEEICETIRTTPEIYPQGSWTEFGCEGTAIKTNIQSTTTQVQLSDTRGIASFSVAKTTSTHDLEWDYECAGELRAWAVGRNGFSREVEVVLKEDLTKICTYSGLPGDTGCTTLEIVEEITSSVSSGTTKEGDKFPNTVTIQLKVPIEGYNRGVTAFGELPTTTVYEDELTTLTREAVIDWSMVDGPSDDDDWDPLGPIIPPPDELPGLNDLPDLPDQCDLIGCDQDPDPPSDPPDEDPPESPGGGKCDINILCIDVDPSSFRIVDLPGKPGRPGGDGIDTNVGIADDLSPSFA